MDVGSQVSCNDIKNYKALKFSEVIFKKKNKTYRKPVDIIEKNVLKFYVSSFQEIYVIL